MFYILLFGTIFFLVVNYCIGKYDYMNPAFIFTGIFLIYEVVCIVFGRNFNTDIGLPTVLVIIAGIVTFTVVNIFGIQKNSIEVNVESAPKKEIKINNYVMLLFIGISLLTIYSSYQYIVSISVAFYGEKRSLGEMISLYDVMMKFWTDIYNDLNITIPMMYRIGKPITTAWAFLMIYVTIYNFIVARKIKVLGVITVGLFCILLLLDGSRSPLFRIMTMAMIEIYILLVKEKKIKRGSMAVLFVLVGVVALSMFFFLGILTFMGRSMDTKISNYIFIYLGAPVINLNNFIDSMLPQIKPEFFGEQTFRTLYNYLGKILSIERFKYDSINFFSFSDSGVEIGNVYTTFSYFLYDFGYLGVVPCTFVMALYYVKSYTGIMLGRIKSVGVDMRLFFYVYLFNDLVMQAFSSRFYETIFDAPFIKILFLTWVLNGIFIEHKFNLGICEIEIPQIEFDYT